MRPAAAALAALLALPVLLPAAPAGPARDGGTFAGSWSAAGRRDVVPTEGGGTAAVFHLSGAMVLEAEGGLGRGFRGEAVGLVDGSGLRAGRSVWTDERGDRIFGELSGQTLQTGARVTGRFTGGTGRYEGITGTFELTWQYVVRDPDGTLQGHTTDLRGRWEPGTASP